jgi:hypothetical protein
MDKATADIEAARKLIAALDRYQASFGAMVRANMDVAIYEQVNACLTEIREAKGVIFSQVASQSVDFVIAHTGLMTSLWNAQLARIRGESAPFLDVHHGNLRAEHDEAVERLRLACQQVLKDRRIPPSPRPSPSPGPGY